MWFASIVPSRTSVLPIARMASRKRSAIKGAVQNSMGTSVVRTAWLCHSGHPYRHAESDLASVVLLDSSSGYLGQRWKVVERHGSGYEREKVQRYLRGKVNHLGSNLAGDIMHLLVIMKTTSVTIDRQVLISLVFVLVSSIVSSV